MLNLPDVTLVTCWTYAHELHEIAVDECLRRVKFGDVKLYSNDARARSDVEVVDIQNVEQFVQFYHYDMPERIKTSHALEIQWDSWVVNPDAWKPEILEYDYIGAPWWYNDNFNVGNSGFRLRSKRLMEFIASHRDEFPIREPEDHVLCREYQMKMPQFRWAPAVLAWRFSFERTLLYDPKEVFGFHGMFNWPRVLTYEQIMERIKVAPPRILASGHCREMFSSLPKGDLE